MPGGQEGCLTRDRLWGDDRLKGRRLNNVANKSDHSIEEASTAIDASCK